MDIFHVPKLSKWIIALALSTAPLLTIAQTHHTHTFYTQHNLVSDGFVPADHTDPNLINPWGIAFGGTSPSWVSNNGSGTSTLYDGLGNPIPLVVIVPPAPSVGGTGSPTGIVSNNTSSWVVSNGTTSAAAAFIFATEDGTISGWAPSVNAHRAIIAVDNSASGAVYKGLTRGADGTRQLLYAANFRSGKVDVFDGSFKPVTLPGSFTDTHIPAGFAPFGIQNINGDIYVAYAQQDPAKHDPVKGDHLGFVSAFDAQGNFLHRVASRTVLNAPWGMVLAPQSFGRFGGHLLIGNFGDGKINAYDIAHRRFNGQLRDQNEKPIAIDGLWGLVFGNGSDNQPTNTLFFSAGPASETHGIYGTLKPNKENAL